MPATIPYSRLDRQIHRLAFRSALLQDILHDLEKKMLSRRWAEFRAASPIFITSLPRAGTTVLLEALHRLPTLATHTYRDMPFVLTPVLWNSLSASFRKSGALRERAHGDGLQVSEDSPEALEEILWSRAFPQKYAGPLIELWSPGDVDGDFTAEFQDHMRKIVSLRRPEARDEGRYLSKNNANIARIDAIRSIFPDAFIIVPIRHPLEHALSLQRQHRNFEKQHLQHPFVRDYMKDLGHYEFGQLHKLIAFDGVAFDSKATPSNSLEYWLEYWISAFEHLESRAGICFVCFESLCTLGPQAIEKIARHLNITCSRDDITDAGSILRAPPPSRAITHVVPDELARRAMSLYGRLKSNCLLLR